MYKRNHKIRKENILNKTNGDVLYFINCIRNFLGKEPILDFMAKKNDTYKNIFKNRKQTKDL